MARDDRQSRCDDDRVKDNRAFGQKRIRHGDFQELASITVIFHAIEGKRDSGISQV